MEKLLTEEQVAGFLGMHPKTLAKKRRENAIALPFVRQLGRNVGYRPQDVERYVDLHTVTLDGSGRPSKRKNGTRKAKPPVHFMTDAEAQAFFKGVEKLDGVLECEPGLDD